MFFQGTCPFHLNCQIYMYSTVHNSFIFQNESHSMLSLLRAWVQSLLEELLIKFHKLCRTVKINKWVSESIVIFLPPILIFSCFLFLLISHGTGLSILLIFSKNQLLALLIFSTSYTYVCMYLRTYVCKYHPEEGYLKYLSSYKAYAQTNASQIAAAGSWTPWLC